MQTYIKEYLDTVKNQVRWKKSHWDIERELSAHITDQVQAYISAGYSEDNAKALAVKDMGDPYEVGIAFDAVYKPKIRWSFIFIIGLFIIIGGIIQWSLYTYLGEDVNITKDFFMILAGILFAIAGYKLDFTAICRHTSFIFTGYLILIGLLTLNTNQFNGIGYFLQYSFIKVDTAILFMLFPIIYAGIIHKMRGKGFLGLMLCGLAFLIIAVFPMFNLRFSVAAMLGLICIPVTFYAIHKNWFGHRKLLLALSLPLIGVLMFCSIAMLQRRLIFVIWPERDPLGRGYFNLMIREALANASLFGTAADGVDIVKRIDLLNSDLMLTFITQKTGTIAFFFIVGFVILFLIKGIVLALKHKSFSGNIISIAIISTYAVQFIIYILNNTGYYLTDVYVPFLNYGGISHFVHMFLFGILISVFSCEQLFIHDNAVCNAVCDEAIIKLISFSGSKVTIDFSYFKY